MTTKKTDKHVIVRTYSAGVYKGVLRQKSEDGKRVVLGDAQIVYSWEGALTTLDLAQSGPSAAKLSQPVSDCEVTEVIAIVAMSPEAVTQFRGIKPWARK